MSTHDPTTARRIGVLSLHNSKETKAILNAVEALGHEPVWLRAENLTGRVDDGEAGLSPAVDVVANRLLLTKADRPLEELGLALAAPPGCDVLNRPAAVMRAMHKYGAAARLSAADVPVPDAVLGLDAERLEAGLAAFDGPAVHKALVGTNGSRMNRVEAAPVGARVGRRRAFLQEYLDAGDDRTHDVRVYVVGGEVVGAMRRYAPDDEWRTNVALGGEVEDATASLDPAAADVAVRAVEALGLDYAGVDLLDDGGWMVLEVNATAGFKGLYEATGTSPAPYIAALAIERAGGAVDRAAVDALAADLDDAVPDCKPDLGGDPEGGVVGFTERVAVAGADGVETTTAKADTGATRTSVDAALAAEIGAGPVVGTVDVKSGSGGTRRRTLVELEVRLDGTWRTVEASVEDRGHLSQDVLLGRDLLSGYRVAVDNTVEDPSPERAGAGAAGGAAGTVTDGGIDEE